MMITRYLSENKMIVRIVDDSRSLSNDRQISADVELDDHNDRLRSPDFS